VHIYYYTDKSRLELDDLMYYRLPKVPVGLWTRLNLKYKQTWATSLHTNVEYLPYP
jgi:hypothetical protein